MKKTILGLFLGMSVMGMAAAKTAESSDYIDFGKDVSSTLKISAKVVSPLTITVTDMTFDDILVNTEGKSKKDSGKVTIDGAPNHSVVITLLDSVSIASGKYKMNVTLNAGDKDKTIDDKGNLNFTISGTIPADQTSHVGVFSGSTPVSVRYN